MELEKDLIGEILLQVEASPDPMCLVDLSIPDHSQEETAYHVQIMDEAGFVEALDLTSMSDYDWRRGGLPMTAASSSIRYWMARRGASPRRQQR